MTTTAAPLQKTPLAQVRLPAGNATHDLRAIKVVWRRELIRFGQDRIRIVTALVQPILYTFVLGTGLASLTRGQTGNVNLRTFIFPGVLALSVMMTAMFSAVSIVWDREFGFPPRDAGRTRSTQRDHHRKVSRRRDSRDDPRADRPRDGRARRSSLQPAHAHHALLRDDAARLRRHGLRSRDRGTGQADPIDDGTDAGDLDAARVSLGSALSVVAATNVAQRARAHQSDQLRRTSVPSGRVRPHRGESARPRRA